MSGITRGSVIPEKQGEGTVKGLLQYFFHDDEISPGKFKSASDTGSGQYTCGLVVGWCIILFAPVYEESHCIHHVTV